MKKHAEALAKIKSEDLVKATSELTTEIITLKKGVRMGDVQNYKQLRAKRKDLARFMTRINIERKAK